MSATFTGPAVVVPTTDFCEFDVLVVVVVDSLTIKAAAEALTTLAVIGIVDVLDTFVAIAAAVVVVISDIPGAFVVDATEDDEVNGASAVKQFGLHSQ